MHFFPWICSKLKIFDQISSDNGKGRPIKPKYDTQPKRHDSFRNHLLLRTSIDKPKLDPDRKNSGNNKINNACGDFSYYSKHCPPKIKAQSVFGASILAIKVMSASH